MNAYIVMKLATALLINLHVTPAEDLEQNVGDEFNLIICKPATVVTPLHCSCNKGQRRGKWCGEW